MGETILFVDDEPVLLDGFRRALSSTFHLETARSGTAALTKLKIGRFTVVVCNMRMPAMDGIQLL